MVYVVVYDGQSRSIPAKIRIVVIPVNDAPILRFTPTGQPVRFPPLANRSHSITYTENGSPLKILPSRTILVDVDSFYAGNATILFNASRSGDIVLVNMSTAARHGVVVIGQGTSSVLLRGIASLEAYLEVRMTFSLVYLLSFATCRSYLPPLTTTQLQSRTKVFLRL